MESGIQHNIRLVPHQSNTNVCNLAVILHVFDSLKVLTPVDVVHSY